MTQAFYRKWRPRLWDEVIGQDHVVQTLRNAVRSGRVGHAYLFAGPRGTGKTTTARLLAKAINCLDPDLANRPCDVCEHCKAVNEGRFMDLIEIDAASNTSVDDVRDLREKINFSPSQGQFKVYIIDEVHMLSTAAFNALLKTLEEPPPHAIFILATTEIHKIPATVLSRCQRHEFRRVPVGQIVALLKQKSGEENLLVDEDAMLLIARQATGSIRDAISLLDQLSSSGQRVTLSEAQVVLGTAANDTVLELVNAVLDKNGAAGLQCIQIALDSGSDARQFARQVVEYLRGLLLVRMNNAGLVDATVEMRSQMAAQAARFETPQLLETIRLFNAAATDTRSSWQPGLGLEMALVEAMTEKRVVVETATPAHVSTGAPVHEASVAPRVERAEREVEKKSAPAAEHKPGGHVPASHSSTAPAEKRSADAGVATPAGSADVVPVHSGKEITETMIRDSWKAILTEAKKRSAKASAALNTRQTMNVKNGVLILGYSSDTTKKMMETESNLDVLKQTLTAVFGSFLPVRCVVVGEKKGGESDGDAEGSMVRTALDLGGKIVYENEKD
jgi:DNA polymerase III subunit gamma/tau